MREPLKFQHYWCRVAHQHFSQVKPGQRDGLLYTIAGIQDLNILFSNIAFMVVLRAFIQVMEAGIQDPTLVVWVQVHSPCILVCFNALL
jgi:hypothetical protein